MSNYYNDQWRLPNNSNKDKQSNYSMDFDGSSQFISIFDGTAGGGPSSLKFTSTDSFSISCWINMVSTSGQENIISFRGTPLIWLYRNSSSIAFRVRGNSGSGFPIINASATIGAWHHVVAIRDYNGGSPQLKLYIDSVAATPVTDTSSGDFDTYDKFSIGNDNHAGGRYWFDGKIDAVSIFNYALTDGTGGTVNQIAALYGSSSTGIGNPMSLSPKPVAYYPLGDQDAFNGADYLVPNSSLKDYVFDFDSTSPGDYISIASAGGIALMNTGVSSTVSLWVYPTGTGTRVFFEQQTNSGRYVIYQSGTSLFFYPNSARASFTNLILNQWYNVVTIVDGSNSKFYVNGNEVGTSTSYTPVNTLGVLEFGRYPGGTQYFQGKLSNVQIFNTNLSGPEVETLYNNGSPIRTLANIPQNSNLQGWYKLDASDTYDSSTGNWTIEDHAGSNDGTSSGMSQANLVQSDLSFTSGYSPYALDFDSASSDYIDCGSFSALNSGTAVTVSAWFKSSTYSNNGRIINNKHIEIYQGQSAYPNTQGRFRYILKGNYGNSFATLGGPNTAVGNLVDGNWHHLCVTFNNSTTTAIVYEDGSPVITNTSVSGTLNSASSNLYIGSSSTSSNFIDGSISNISIWNTGLTSSQVTELYNEGVPSNLNNHSAYSNLISWWQLGSNSSFNSSLNQWTCIDEKGTNTGESSQTFNEDAIVDGVGSYANGLSSGMGGDEVIGDAPYSTSNALSVNMDVEDRVTDTPS